MSTKPDLLVVSPWYSAAMAELEDHFTVHKLWKAEDKGALLASLADTCEAIAGSSVCGADIMDALPKTKVIAHHGVGYDGVDVAAATARGIKVSNTPDVLSDEVADFAIGLLIATCRRIPQADRYVREGRWESDGDMTFTTRVHGRKVGILGLGRIGIEIARRCEAFKMDIAYHTRSRRDVPYTYYDSLVAKLVVHGASREECLMRADRALGEYVIGGIPTTIPLHHDLMKAPAFRSGDYHIRWLETEYLTS